MKKLLFGGMVLLGIIGCSTNDKDSLSLPTTSDQWMIKQDGIVRYTSTPMQDHFAMAGRQVDVIAEWKIGDDMQFSCTLFTRFPMLRTIPDNTRAALSHRFTDSTIPLPKINGAPMPSGITEKIGIRGVLEATSVHGNRIRTKRTIFPSLASPAVINHIELTNITAAPMDVTIPAYRHTLKSKPGVYGTYTMTTEIVGSGQYRLAPNETLTYAVISSGGLPDEPPFSSDPTAELAARESYINAIFSKLILETPEREINLLFAMTKLHAAESIFTTRGGLMHAPGGYGKYLAAVWANDQAEYINPFFPFLGDVAGNESALNSFRHFARFMNPEFKPIPSSIIAEGRGTWHGAGDRGDMAMIAHGATRFVLGSANKAWAEELLPLIQWCLEYCKRQTTKDGVIASKSDELENRFPSGDANLCTATLYYDALLRAADLLDALGTQPQRAKDYRKEADTLKQSIIKHFCATMEGYKTYRYYDGNTVLRSWICMPLVFGIEANASGTVDALFSDQLWTGNGLLCASNNRKTYWDRSALYAFRGIFFAGFADSAIPFLRSYTHERLLGAHVPYPIEAYPELNQSHLSAESALYGRIFTEGLFGITPTGLDSFTVKANLPATWKRAAMRKICAFGHVFGLEVEHISGNRQRVTLSDIRGNTIDTADVAKGETLSVKALKFTNVK